MANEKVHDLKLVGEGSAGGGVYNKVEVVGQGAVIGDLECVDFKVCGTCEVNGNLKAKTSKIVGETKIKGNLELEELKIVGTSDIFGNVGGKQFKIEGNANIKGGISTEGVDINGWITVNGDCNAEVFSSKGVLTIDGLLNAGKIDIMLHSQCQIKEIGGEKINVRRGTGSLLKRIINSFYLPSDFYMGKLSAETIEGDDVYIEYTKAKLVRGNNVIIGADCEIDLVEYKGNFEKSVEAVVTQNRKV